MGKNTTTSNSSTTSAAPQATQAYSNLLTQAQGVASTPYQAYTGELTAPVNAQQQTGISGINAAAGQAQPGLAAANNQAIASSAPITGQTIQNYQNPYTQQVVNATEAQINNQNQQQQSQLLGNQISQGALGGNRVGVAQANLGAQQSLANNSTVAGLYSNSYQQALAAAQAQQQTGLAGANAQANFAVQGQNAALTGAGAQLGAGTVEQQTQQATDTANQQAYAQAQAYPFQTTQWLAGIDTGVAPGLGSSSTGQTTAPPPNQTAQYLGAGLTAASFLSRGGGVGGVHYADGGEVRSDADPQGVSAGQRYAAASDYQIRPNQDGSHSVINVRTGQIHFTGTPSGAQNAQASLGYRNRASGGAVQHFDGGGVAKSPWGSAPSWVPQISMGSAAPHAGSAPAAANTTTPAFDYSKIIAANNKDSNGLLSGPSYGGGNVLTDAYGGSSSNPLPGLDASDYGAGFARGGIASVRPRFADGGAPDDQPQGVGAAVWNPDEPFRMPEQAAVDAWRAGTPVPPLGTPPVAAADDDEALPPEVTSGASRPPAGVGGADAQPMAFAPGQPTSGPTSLAPTAPTQTTAPDNGGGLGLLNLSHNARSGLLAAGLGMLASRSPNFGNAIGEGGLAGAAAYGAGEERDRKVADEAAKLSREAQNHAEDMKYKTDTFNETVRSHKANEENAADKTKFTPSGSLITADGEVHPLVLDQYTGKAIDAVTQKPPQSGDKVTAKGEKPVVSDEDAKAVAQRYVRTGDRTQLQGLGVSGAARQKVNHYIAEVQKEEGLSDQDLGTRVAEWEGRKAGQRVLGTQEAKMGSAAFEAEGAMNLARGTIDKVPRTSFLPFNKLIEGYSRNTLDPNQVELYGRAQAIVNTYAAVMARGANITTDSARGHAAELLNTAGDHDTWNRMLDTMQQEINMAKGSPEKMREFYRKQFGEKSVAQDATHPAMAAPDNSGFSPPPGAIKQTTNGKTYYYDPNTKQPYPGQ